VAPDIFAPSLLAPDDQKPAAILLYNPATDLMRFAKPEEEAAARAISPSQLPLEHLPPTAIFHGTADRTVPFEEARAFCARAQSAGAACELNAYAGRDHSFFHDKTVDPALGFAPYDDTLAKSLAFLAAHNLSP
jgi:acetyl esterase